MMEPTIHLELDAWFDMQGPLKARPASATVWATQCQKNEVHGACNTTHTQAVVTRGLG
jgi:hypothetical protein